MEGIYNAEYENIRDIYPGDDQGKILTATCQASLKEFSRTIRDLDTHIRNNLLTDCFLAYEIMEIVTNLSFRLESSTGELRRPVGEALAPIRDTAKSSMSKLLDDTKSKVQSLLSLPIDAGAVPITSETMSRISTMAAYLTPVSSILTSLGEGGWNSPSGGGSSNSIPTMKSFDVGADGRQLFAKYGTDMLEALVSGLDNKVRVQIKSRLGQGVFMSNNVAIIERMMRTSGLRPLMLPAKSKIDGWRKKGLAMYLEAWREPSAQLFDVQYTPSGGGGASGIDSAAVIKALSSKDKDAIKEKFRNFNQYFDNLITQHKQYKMEPEVREMLANEVQKMIDPLYARFWDRYHEVDKGKGKYVKYDKASLTAALAGLE